VESGVLSSALDTDSMTLMNVWSWLLMPGTMHQERQHLTKNPNGTGNLSVLAVLVVVLCFVKSIIVSRAGLFPAPEFNR